MAQPHGPGAAQWHLLSDGEASGTVVCQLIDQARGAAEAPQSLALPQASRAESKRNRPPVTATFKQSNKLTQHLDYSNKREQLNTKQKIIRPDQWQQWIRKLQTEEHQA